METHNLHIGIIVRTFATDGGLELYTHKLVEGLLQRGHRVTVFCQTSKTTLEHHNLTVRMMALRDECVPKSEQYDWDARAAAAIRKEATKCDIIHSQHYPIDFAEVVTFHNHTINRLSEVGLDWEKQINDMKCAVLPAYKERERFDRTMCATVLTAIFPSKVMQEDYYSTYSFLESRHTPYVIARPGATLSQPADQADQFTPEKERPFTFLFVGRGFRKKGVDVLLRACVRLKQEGLDFRLLIAGMKEKAPDTVRKTLLGLGSNVKYLGFRQDMHNVYSMADAIVLPSRVEPFGMAPIQAMSFGLVPIVSRICGVAEVLTPGHDSLILDKHLSGDRLAVLMRQLVEDREFYNELQKNVRTTASRVTWEDTVDHTVEAYVRAISIKKAKRAPRAAVK